MDNDNKKVVYIVLSQQMHFNERISPLPSIITMQEIVGVFEKSDLAWVRARRAIDMLKENATYAKDMYTYEGDDFIQLRITSNDDYKDVTTISVKQWIME